MPPSVDTTHIASLCDQGLYLSAYEASRPFGPLKTWRELAERLLAARLAHQLGAPRLGKRLRYLAHREHRDDPRAALARASMTDSRRGPYGAWKLIRSSREPDAADTETRADWLAFRGSLAGMFRDFDSADQWHAKAVEVAPERPIVWVCRSSVLIAEDQYTDALDAANHGLSLQPWFVPAVRRAAETLVCLGQDEQALTMLCAACEHVESGYVWIDRANLQSQLGQYAAALESYARASEALPLIERSLAHWLAGRRSDMAYLCGDLATCKELAWLAANPFHDRIGRTLTDAPEETRRVLLPVQFVRQHHMTCAPATMAAISAYWSVPSDHLEIAEEICYDGTPSRSQRKWAEQQGWVVREFAVTWDSAQTLLDRDVPIAVSTVEPASAHMQAIVGYDTCRQVLLIRDPYQRELSELVTGQFFDRYRFCGPRAMVMVPSDKAHLLERIELPDTHLYDLLYRLEGQLEANRRDEAQATFEALQREAADHRLAIEARRYLANYDGDAATALQCIEELLERFPGNSTLQLQKLGCLNQLNRREERLALLRDMCARHDCHPVFWHYHAAELRVDAREHDQAFYLLRRALRHAPQWAELYYSAAGILWQQRRFDEAIHLNRIAACLDDKDERFAQTYFVTARQLNETDAALAFLRNRAGRLRKRSSLPVQTLFWALEEVDRGEEAFAEIADALQLRADDFELMLYAADAHARHGQFDRANQLLEQSANGAHHQNWLRTAANIAMYRGAHAEALGHWRQVLDSAPQAADAHRAIVQLLAEIDGPQAATEHLTEAATRWPYSFDLQAMRIEQLREQDSGQALAAVQQLVERFPSNAWVRRELAWHLARTGQMEQAFAMAQVSRDLEPAQPDTDILFGALYALAGNRDKAREACRNAIRQSVDAEQAIARLISLCNSADERRAELTFLYGELSRQVIVGNGLCVYHWYARQILEPDRLLEVLREANTARPDLQQSWLVLVRQLVAMGDLAEARDLGMETIRRFSLSPEAWYELASVYHAREELDAMQEALQQALHVAPTFTAAAQQLAAYHQQHGNLTEARTLLERAAARDPFDAENQMHLAVVLWESGTREAALARAERAIQMDPGNDNAWNTLVLWCQELGRHELPAKIAADLTTQRPGNAESWLLLARMLRDSDGLPRRLEAIERAIALQPTSVEAHRLKMYLLAENGQLDAALAVCQSTVFGDQLPAALRAVAAEIEDHRGNQAQAFAELQAAVAAEPTDPGYRCALLDACIKQSRTDDGLELATDFTRVMPQSPQAWWYLSWAQHTKGDRDAAKQSLRQAVALDPAESCWALSLARLHGEQNELDKAAKVMAHLKQHATTTDPDVASFEVVFAARRGDEQSAMTHLRELCSVSAEDAGPLLEAAEELGKLRLDCRVRETLSAALDDPNVQPQAAEAWATTCDGDPRGFCERLRQLRAKPDLWRHAVFGYLRTLVDNDRLTQFNTLMAREGDALHADDQTWRAVGEMLSSVGQHDRAAEWLADWQQHSTVDANLLEHLCCALTSVRRDAEARPIRLHAEGLVEDPAAHLHSLWLAADEAASGQIDTAKAHLQRVTLRWLEEGYLAIHALANAMITVEGESQSQGTGSYSLRVARQRLDKLIESHRETIFGDQRLRDYYFRYLGLIVGKRGNVIQRLWHNVRFGKRGQVG